MMATTARQHSLCPHTSSPSPSPSASLFSQPVQTSLILTSRSTPTDDVCMKVVESNTIQIVKDSTLIRFIPTATKEAPSQFPYSSSALLGPLLSKHFTFDRIYDQSDALLSPYSLTSSESQLAYANRRRLQQEELYARSIRTHLKQTIEGRGLCVIANGPSNREKTLTFVGDSNTRNNGIIGLALEELLQICHSRSSSTTLFQLQLTLHQLQHDRLRDLLYFDGSALKIVTMNGKTDVAGSRRIRLRTPAQIDEIVDIYRTSCQLQSAHSIMTVEIEHLNLDMARELSMRREQTHLAHCINLVSTVQFVHLASIELSLAPSSTNAVARRRSTIHTPVTTVRRSPATIAGDYHSGAPTLVKQAQRTLRLQREEMKQKSVFRRPVTSAEEVNQTPYVPTSEFEQKILSRSFEALEQVLFQLSTKPSSSASLDSTNSGESPRSASNSHISYRSNKLTWLLADTLKLRASQTVLLNFVSPVVTHLDHSMATIRWAARIREWFQARHEKLEMKKRKEKQQQQQRRREQAKDEVEEFKYNDTYPSHHRLLASAADASHDDANDHASHMTAQSATLARDDVPLHDASSSSSTVHLDDYLCNSSPSSSSSTNALDHYLSSSFGSVFMPTTSVTTQVKLSPSTIYPQHSAPPSISAHRTMSTLRAKDQTRHSTTSASTTSQFGHPVSSGPTAALPREHQTNAPMKEAPSSTSTSSTPTNVNAAPISSPITAPQSASQSVPTNPTSNTNALTSASPPSLPSSSFAAPPTTTTTATSSGPDRIFDVLDVLRTARFGGREDEPSAGWPYQKDFILTELSNQLAAWQSNVGIGKITSTIDELIREFGEDIPASELKRRMRGVIEEEKKTINECRKINCKTPPSGGVASSSMHTQSQSRLPSHPSSTNSARVINLQQQQKTNVPVHKQSTPLVHSNPLNTSPMAPLQSGPVSHWPYEQVASVKAEIKVMDSQLNLPGPFPTQDQTDQSHEHTHFMPVQIDAHSSITVPLSSSSSAPAPPLMSSTPPNSTTATYCVPSGQSTQFTIRPYDTHQPVARTPSYERGLISPPLTSLSFHNTPSPSTAAVSSVPSMSVYYSTPPSIRPNLSSEFNAALSQQSELHETLSQAEELVKRLQLSGQRRQSRVASQGEGEGTTKEKTPTSAT